MKIIMIRIALATLLLLAASTPVLADGSMPAPFCCPGCKSLPVVSWVAGFSWPLHASCQLLMWS